MTDTFRWYLGVDWGQEAHQLCLLDASGRVLGTRTVAHRADAIHEALQWIQDRTGASLDTVAVGIETPRGVLVDTLIEYRCLVFAINPKQLDRFRDRFTAAGAKDDRRDAQAIADGLRTDARAFRAIRADDPQVIQVRELVRLRDDLQVEEGRLTNRLREQLYRVDAAWLELCPAADEPWLWALLADAPHPEAWAGLPRRRITPVLRTHRIRRLQTDHIVAALRRPRLTVAPGVPDAVAARLASLVPQLRLIHHQRSTTEQQLDRLLETLASADAPDGQPGEHRDVEILRSLPGVGRIVTATMLAEATGPLADRDYATLRAYAGTAPVTKRSGKRLHLVQMRYACKARLRQALYHWARISIQHDSAARGYYDALRGRGHGHARALRSVADRWLRILVAMLTAHTLYDPSRLRSVMATT